MTSHLIPIAAPQIFQPDRPFSPAIRAGSLIVISGQVGVDQAGATVAGGIEPQTRRAFESIGALLEAAGAGWADVAELTYYLLDCSDFGVVDRVRREFISEPFPASTAVGVASLIGGDWLIEISALAVLPAAALPE